ncbi:MAG: hypothetical protein CL938_13500 [Deltaproteobacteria bacterium]|nr:hypothetical protein [Deltaproteobacteria bacterium]
MFPGLPALFALAPPGSLMIATASADDHGSPIEFQAKKLLGEAFQNRYGADMTATIDLILRNTNGQERVRRFRAASKRIEGRTHTIGRLVWPEYLRGMTILTIEAHERSHDAFIYLPSLQKVRRINTSQRGDAFLGSDVTYEDLERRRVDEYEVVSLEVTERGEPAWTIGAKPIEDFTYERVDFVVAAADYAILESRYFKRGSEDPFRIITTDRSDMVEQQGHVLPTRMFVRNSMRGTSTEVVFRDLIVGAPIDDKLFSVSTLERRRSLPGESR